MRDLDAAGEQVGRRQQCGFGFAAACRSRPARQREMIDLIAALDRACRASLRKWSSGDRARSSTSHPPAFQPGPNMAVYFATKAYVLRSARRFTRK